jgi:hypothetical protein
MNLVEYNDVPDIIKDWFQDDSYCIEYNGNGRYIISFELNEIVAWSKNIEEIEIILNIKKYNL